MVNNGLLLKKGGSGDGKSVNLSKAATVLGRGIQVDIKVDAPGASQVHARILAEFDGYWIEDLGSCNGTYLNGERVGRQPRRIQNHDRLELGGLASQVHWVFMEPMDTVEIRRMALE